jgi:hypothetical protein
MAGNSRPSFTKRTKERARQEKQAEKAQRRSLRKSQKEEPVSNESSGTLEIRYDEDGLPQPLDFHDF